MQEGVGANSPDGDLLFEVTTVTYDGEYAPDHVSAFWVEDAEGVFVKTLEVAAAKRIQYLRRWREASSENVVDAVTGATLPEHGPRQVHWDLTDTSGRTVPFGLYRVVAEMSEHNGAGTWVSTPFEVSNEPLEIDEPGGPGFIDLRLLYTP